MAKLSVGQIYNAARKAGFKPAAAVIATAIALAESEGGDPNAHCDDCFPGVHEDSRGLWQINVVAHPQFAGWNLYDPATNARAAFSVSNGGRNFNPWSTWGTTLPGHTGSANAQLPKVWKALGIAGGAPAPDSVPGADVPSGGSASGGGAQAAGLNLNPLDGFGLFSSIGSAVVQDFARVAITSLFVIGGVALVVIGFYRGVQPAVQRTKERAEQAAGTIAKAAAL